MGLLDYLIIDLPPGTGDVALSLIQTVPLTGAIIVSTPSDVALQDARKAIEMFRQMKVDIVGMVENMSYFVCPHCQHEIDIFSRGGAEKTAKQFDIAYLGNVELDPRFANPAMAALRPYFKAKTHRTQNRCSPSPAMWWRESKRSKPAARRA